MPANTPSQAYPPGGRPTISHAPRRMKVDGQHIVKSKCPVPRFDLILPGRPTILDVEGCDLPGQPGVFKKGSGRVSLAVLYTDERFHVAYDTYVYYPTETGQEAGYSRKSGVYPDDILPENDAKPIAEVMKNLHRIFSVSKYIICHSLQNEQQFLRGLPWGEYTLIDTQLFPPFKKHGAHGNNIPSLKAVAENEFGWVIQTKQHDSTVDCRATGEAFFKYETQIIAQQVTPEFQSSLLWMPNDAQREFWAEDATVKSLGPLAWHPPKATSDENQFTSPEASKADSPISYDQEVTQTDPSVALVNQAGRPFAATSWASKAAANSDLWDELML